MSGVLVALVTVPTRAVGTRIAKALVEERLAACVNIVPGVRSIYAWKGRVCDDRELLLVIKTTRGRYAALERRVKAMHPYEVPEVIALPIVRGSSGYLKWVRGIEGRITR
jgi:periplasmic divalent cation tolerance protein